MGRFISRSSSSAVAREPDEAETSVVSAAGAFKGASRIHGAAHKKKSANSKNIFNFKVFPAVVIIKTCDALKLLSGAAFAFKNIVVHDHVEFREIFHNIVLKVVFTLPGRKLVFYGLLDAFVGKYVAFYKAG